MMNIQGLMKQAQQMQKKLQEEQEKLAQEEVEGTSGGGMVKTTLNGKYTMLKLQIDRSLVNADETDILEDLVMAAYNDAKNKIDAKMNSHLGSITDGLNLGGLKLPF
ncbi:MAG: YbaB/EbfC family nucleoid-associated protein [Alphaproteobacteria bacterium]|nr:YbaB/EbfC family nucleoid-associated protein [Alphaproteobacteria bacterium]